MELYKNEKITKEAVRTVITILESQPIRCITFVGLTNNLREDWIEAAVKGK